MTDGPVLDITRVDHIAMAVPELEPRLEFFENLFGLRRVAAEDDQQAGVRRATLAIPGTNLRWQLIAPLGDGAPEIREFLDSPRGPGIYHAAFDVPDVPAAVESLRAAGIEPAEANEDRIVLNADGGRGLRFVLRGPGASDAASGAGGAPEPAPTDERSLGVIGVDHVCHACPDRDELGGWYERTFGMRETHRTPDGEHEDLADLVLEVPGRQMRWEVLQPVGEGSFVERFLSTRGSSVHHVAFEVGDWGRAMAACERYGVEPFDHNSGETDGAAWNDAFLHPKVTGGVLLQLFWEARRDAWVASDKVPSRR